MEKHVVTIIVEPRLLVREALASLLASHSYHVVGGVASTADIDDTSLAADAPKLVILGALPDEDIATAASSIRKLWPETKIVLLFDHASPANLHKLLASQIDGCIPLSASPDMLIGTLQQIIAADLRMLVLKAASCSVVALPSAQPPIDPIATSKEVSNGGDIDGASSIRSLHSLSDREEQILRGLIKGHSNKVIARSCDITEATIKVHMKSILKKIRVVNRTQAAIWALEQGYGVAAMAD